MDDIETTITESIGTRLVDCLAPGASVAAAADAIRANGIGCVLVVEEERLVGIFTERDFLNRVAVPGKPLDNTTLADVMTRDPETLGPEDDIRFAINKMAVGGFRHVPIVDTDRKPIGVISVRDVIERLTAIFAAVDPKGGAEVLDEWVDVGGG